MAILADRMGIDIWEVVDAAATKPYGFMRFEPGPGMGGHCLPVDPFYLTWKSREYDLSTEFIELAGKVNQQMPYFCLEKAVRALNDAGKLEAFRAEVIEQIASRDTKTLFEDCAKAQISPATFAKAQGILREKIQLAYRQIFDRHDIAAILFPTSPIVAPLINPNGDRRDAQIELNGRRVNLGQTLFRNTRVTGALGAPGLSLPAGLTRDGLPVGLELDGLNGADAELLSVGLRFEQILGPLPPPSLW